jgi:DNA-binding CsgD family transcriptional regulator/tetratricopeptide (TPR) repeat protein
VRMSTMDARDLGEDAYARRAWREAFAQLTSADTEDPLDAKHLEQLAVSAHCLGKDEVSVEAWGRAYAAHLDAGDVEAAAMAASWCAFGLLTRGEFALGSGWLARAHALCEEHAHDCSAAAFVQAQSAAGMMFQGDAASALPMFESAARFAERVRDQDVLTLSQLGRGQCLATLGRASEGLQVLDQLMVSIRAGAVSPLVSGLAFCGAIDLCQKVLDVRRAQEWTAALTRWCEDQPDLVPYRGNCLVHRAEILALHGAWPEAYAEAERARDWLAEVISGPTLGSAYYRLGELHRLRGEYAEAEAAYKQASRNGCETQPGLGLLRLSQGHVASAAAAIRRALEEIAEPIRRAPLLSAQVEVALAGKDSATASAAVDELASVAAELDVPLLHAQLLFAQGSLCLDAGDARAALVPLRSAWTVWQELQMPYDAARSRVLLGLACGALGDTDTAEMELDAARWVFHELGAAADLVRVEALSKRAPAAAPGGLSLREVQVLRLVATGKSNRAIADELFLSEKTVHRHLSNIFVKLEVSSRAAATAYAFRHDLV